MKNMNIIKMKFLTFLFLAVNVFSQTNTCNLSFSNDKDYFTIDKNDLLCLAKNSNKRHTIFFTFASWCKPCRLHLPDALYLEKTENVELYIVLPDSEGGKRLYQTLDFLKKNHPEAKRLVLKTTVYGTSLKQRNKNFVEDITPSKFEVIDDYSKFIVVSQKGEILFVSNWKDYDGDWKNGKAMMEKRILPLLK